MINKIVLMSGTDYFSDEYAINPYMDNSIPVDIARAQAEHIAIRTALESAGVTVEQVPAPPNCQDGIYTANWGLARGNKAVLSVLPNKRKGEEPYAREQLEQRGFEVIEPPFRFSGQGDSLPCGNLLFTGSNYRTDPKMHQFLAETLGYKVIGLQTVPNLDAEGNPKINEITGWPDSFFYDIDLALAVLTPNLVAWCPEAFTPDSQAKIRALSLDKIEVDLTEATKGFACNLVSTGETVVMSAHAPLLKAAIEAKDLKIITPEVTEIAKGGGYIRCTTLTLDNA
jgi:N-dimethylarginine dimethylaminohydrolase